MGKKKKKGRKKKNSARDAFVDIRLRINDWRKEYSDQVMEKIGIKKKMKYYKMFGVDRYSNNIIDIGYVVRDLFKRKDKTKR